MANSLQDYMYSWFGGIIDGPQGGTPLLETIASWTGIHALVRPSSLATVTSLTNAGAAVVNGSTYDCGYVAIATAVQITSSATLTAGEIRIQNSVDNIAWADAKIITAATDFTGAVTKNYSFAADTVGGTGRFWRVNISTILVGGTVTAKVRSS